MRPARAGTPFNPLSARSSVELREGTHHRASGIERRQLRRRGRARDRERFVHRLYSRSAGNDRLPRAPLLCIILPTAWLPAVWWSLPALILVGVWASGRAERSWGRDPGRVVIDEIAGALVTVATLPPTLPVIWTGFFLFRAFDILKPPPIRWCERLPGGWGVMADDIAAGLASNLALRLIIHLIPGMA